MRTAKTLIRLGGYPGWSESSQSAHLISLVLSCGGPLEGSFGPRQANLVLIAYASSEGSGEPAHPPTLARTSAACSYKQ